MESLFSPVENVCSTWLSPGFITWGMDKILAFVCGLGLFHMVPFYSSSSPPPEKTTTTTTKMVMKREHSKAREKIRTMEAYRGSTWKRQKGSKLLLSFWHSIVKKVIDTVSFYQLFRGDASGEVSKPETANDHKPPRQPTKESVTMNLSQAASSAPLREHQLPRDFVVSPVLQNSLAFVESQSSMSASRPPETLTPGRRHSPAPSATSPASCPSGPVPCSPSMPDPSMAPPQRDWETPVQTSHPTPLTGLPSPIPTTPGLDDSRRPVSGPSWYQVAAETWCRSSSSQGESLREHLSLSLRGASLWTNPTYRQVEAGKPSFISPDVQENLEFQIRKRVELKIWEGKGKERLDCSVICTGGMLQACRSEPANNQGLLKNCDQLFWGLPFLHSESLVATVRMDRWTDAPFILFNGLANAPPQLFSPKPLLHHVAKSQPFTPNLSLSMAGIQTQARGPSSTSKLPCHSPPTRDYVASRPVASRSQFIVPPAAQHLECHLLNKHQEMNNVPAMVKKSQEAFNPLTSISHASQGQESVVPVPGEFINPQFREQLEQHLKKRFMERQDQWPHKIQLSLELIKSQHRLSGMGQADSQKTSSFSGLEDASNQHLQSVPSRRPEIFQIRKDPCKDMTNSLERSLKDPHSTPEGSLGKVLEFTSETEMESDSQSPQPVGPGKKPLDVILKNAFHGKWGHTNDSKVPVGICHGIHHTLAPHDNSETKPSLNSQTTRENTSNGLSFLDPGTQKVLETHLTRRLVRHRWSLPLRGLKTIHHLHIDKAVALKSSQSLTPSLTCWDSRDDSIDKMASVLCESVQKDARKKVTTEIASIMQNSPTASQLEFLTETPPSDNYGPSEDPSTVQKDNVTLLSTQDSLAGTACHSDMVFGSWTGNLEPSPNLVKGDYESQENEEAVTLRDLYQGVSVPEISVASQSPISRELEEVEEESCDRVLHMDAKEMAKLQTKNERLRGLELPQTSKSQSLLRTVSQDPEDSGLSAPHSATAVVLQDCATGMFVQDCVSEVLLAADILASKATQSSFKTLTTTSKSASQDSYPLSKERNVSTVSKPQEPWTSHIFGPSDTKERPNIEECNSSPEKKFGDKIKTFVTSILTPKYKSQENSLQKVRALSITQSQGSVTSRVFTHQKVAEAQDLITSVGWIGEMKPGAVYVCAPSKTIVHKESAQAPVSRHVCYHSSIDEANKAQGNTICVHQARPKLQSQPSTVQGNTICVHQPRPKLQSQPSTAQRNTSCVHQARPKLQGQPSTAQGNTSCVHQARPKLQGQPFTAQQNTSCVHQARPKLQGQLFTAQRNTSCVHQARPKLQGQPFTVQGNTIYVHQVSPKLQSQPSTAYGNTSCVHQARPKLQGQIFTNQWISYYNQTLLSREAVSQANMSQQRVQEPHVPGNPVHCPRHCPRRSVLSGKARAFPHLPR